MNQKFVAIKAIIEAEHFVVITPKKQIARTPINGGLKFWEFLDTLWGRTMRDSRQSTVEKEIE